MKREIQQALTVLESEPNNADALAALAAAVEGGGNGKSDPAADRALDEARRTHREKGDFNLVVRMCDLELGWQKDPAKRAELFLEKGRVLADELWQTREAEASFQKALEANPDDAAATEALTELALVRDNLDNLTKKFADVAREQHDNKALASSMHLELAALLGKHRPGPEVETALRKALEIDPRNKKAASHLERMLRDDGRWADLATLFAQRIEGTPAKEERVALCLALAEVERDRLGRRDLAIETMKKVLTLDPLSTRAMGMLVDVYTIEENWQALLKVYENALKARPRGDAEQGILLQIGMVWWRKLGNADAAEEQFRKVRKNDPAQPLMLNFYRAYHNERNEGAKLLLVLGQAQKVETDEKKRLGLAVEMARVAEASAGSVEKAIDIWKSVFKLDKTSNDAVDALKRLYQRTEKWNALLELLKEQIDALPKDDAHADERVARLLEVVAIYRDRLNLDVMVINTYNTILSIKPDQPAALQQLAAKYETMGRWNDLINVLQRQADAEASSAATKAQLLRRVATLWIEKFGNHNQAVKPLEELYALTPGDTDVVLRLRDIYTKRRAWRALLDLERRELERLEGVERRPKLVEMAKLAAERLGDVRESIALWNRLLEDDPHDTEALAALVQLYERDKRYPALVEVMQRQRQRMPDPKLQLALLEKVGAIWAERLALPAKAIETYQEILKLIPNHAKTVRILRELFAQAGDFVRLEQLYASTGQWDELCETLLAVAERSAETSVKLQLYGRVADIAVNQLRQPERAAKAFERILAVDANHLEAAKALVPIYRKTEKWARLLATYEILLGHANTDEQRHDLLREIRVLCEEKLGSKQLAFSWCAKAFAVGGAAAPVVEMELDRLAREADAYEELVKIYAADAEKAPEGERKVARLRQLGDLVGTKLNKPEEARRWYGAVLERVPGDVPALAALEQIYAQAGSWSELLGIYHQRVGQVKGAERTELLFKIAWIEEEKGPNLDDAAATYQRILADEPGSTKALRALERIYAARQNWSALVKVLSTQLELVGGMDGSADAEVGISFQLGELHELKLAKRDVALPFYRRAFARQPLHRPTLAALERYLPPESPSRVEVARLLAPVYEKADEVARLVEVLAILLGSITAKPGEPAAGPPLPEELSLLRRLTTLVGRRLGDVEAAFGYASRLFQLVPEGGDVRRELVELADLMDNHAELAKLLASAEVKVAAGQAELARDIAWELGQLHEERLRKPEDAERDYQRVLTYDKRHEGAFRALERLYRGGERYGQLRALLAARKELTDDAMARRDLLFQICDLDEGVLENQAQAARSYLEVLEVEPSSSRAFKALERIYADAQQWKELDGLLERAVPFAEKPEDRAQLKFRRGDLKLSRLDDATGACDLFEAALEEDKKNDGARKGLEKLMTRPELRLRVARTLEPHYRTDEAWPKLAQALLAQRERAEGREAVELLAQIAELVEEKLGSRQHGFNTWREALLLDPTDDRVRTQVERLGFMLEKYVELAQAWEDAEQKAPPHDHSLRAELLRKAALLYDERLDDKKKARLVWRRLLDLDPTNLETARPAAEALERLYQGEESWSDLIGILRRQAEWAESAPARKEFLRRIGLIQEDLSQDYDGAIATHRETLEIDPEDRGALDALERVHAAQDQWGDLIGVLRRRVSLANDPAARRELLWRIAELTEKKLQPAPAPHDVIAGYTAILDEEAEDVPALDALARLYQATERPGDLLEILERRLALEGSVQERVALRARLAGLLEGPLGRPEQALDRWREVVLDDTDNQAARQGLERMLGSEDLRLRAAEVLEPIYEGLGDSARLIQLSELWAEHAPDPKDRIARLKRISSLRQAAGELPAAFTALARAARVAVAEPELPSLLDGLEQLTGKGGLKTELVNLYRELATEILDARQQERVHLTVAAVSRALGDRVTARDYYRRVLDTAPEHARALDSLEELYAEGHEHEPLLEIYNRRADLAAGDDDRHRHYLALAARLCEKQLGRQAEAVACYEQILSIFPADDEAAKALESLYGSSGRNADLCDLLERRLGFAEDTESAVAIHFRLGELYEKELSDSDRAVENYRAALGGDPDHHPSIVALERFLGDLNHRVDAAEVLEPVYAARHDWRSLIRIYEIRLEAAEDPVRRLALTRRIARAYEEQLEDLDAAFRWYGKVFREEPTDRGIREQLARLAGILDCYADLAAIYDDYLQDTYEDTPASLEVNRTLAGIYDARLNDVDKAKAAYLRILRFHPDDAPAFGMLEALLTRSQRWRDLLDVYRDAADGAADGGRRKALLFKICIVQEDALSDSEAAIESYRAILEIDADDARGTEALDRLYVAGKRWTDLVELLVRQLDKVDQGGRAKIKLRLGGVYEKELEDLASAIDAYEEVLSIEPRSVAALSSLERLILHHDQRYRIAQILEPLYRAMDEWAKLVVIYDAELEFIDDKIKRVELLKEIARLHGERGGDLKLAFGALSRAWTEEATEGEDREAPLYQRLVEISTSLKAWRELVRVLEKGIDGSYDYDLVGRVNARVAEIHDARLGDPGAAVDSWRKVVGVRDDDAVAWKALERLLGTLGRQADLVLVLEKRGELSQDIGEQKALAYRAADLYERTLAQPEQAIATWRRVLSLDEDDRPALASLARLYLQRSNWRELAEIYGRQIELSTAETERRPLRFALAKVQEEHLGDAFEAISAYKGALDANLRDLEALEALTRLYEKEGLFPDLLEALDAIAEQKAKGPERDVVRVRAAKVLEEKQSEPEAAIDRYRQILDESPTNDAARLALEALVQKEETRDAAAAVLEPLYRARGDYAPLVSVLELRLAADTDPTMRRQLLASIAELQEAGLEEPAAAFRAWGRLLGEDSGDAEAYEQLERLAEVCDLWTDLTTLYEARLDGSFDPEVQRVLALKLAALYETRLADDARAVARYRKALDLPGDELVPLAALDRLLSRIGPPRDLADVLEREAQAVNEPEHQADYLFRLGELRRGPLRDGAGAMNAYRDALDRAPGHAAARAAVEAIIAGPDAKLADVALDLLEPIYDADGDHGKRVALAEARLRLIVEKPQRAQQLGRIARLCEDDLGDRVQALNAAIRAITEMPDDHMLADEVERLAAPQNLPIAAAAFEAVLEAGVPTDTGKELGLRTARLYERLLDNVRAEARYVAVLDVDPENQEALQALEGIYRSLGDMRKLVDILDRRAEAELDVAEKKKMFGEAARLQETELGDAAGAVEGWQKVLEVDESDVQALSALAVLHEAGERWKLLVAILEQMARFADSPSDQIALKGRIAALYSDRIGDLERAIEAYRDLVDAAPDALGAMGRLEELLAQKGDWLAVQEVLVRKLGALPAGSEQVPTYRRLAQVALEHQNAPEDAIGYYQQILDIAPEDQTAARDLEALLAKLAKWYDLVDALKRNADVRARVGDREGEVALLVRAADVLEEKLESPEGAGEILETILQRDPRNVRALTQLAKIYEAARELDKCKEILERAAAQAPGGDELAELQYRLGRLEAERVGRPEAAEPYFRAALAASAYHTPSIEALEKAARARNEWANVAELVTKRAEKAPTPADQKALWLELGAIYGDKLGKASDAIGALEKARKAAPDDPAILEQLADRYFNAGKLAEALPVYQGLLERLSKGGGRRTKEQARLHFRLGAIAEKQGDGALSLSQYQSAYQIDAGHAPTLSALGRLYSAAGEWEKARRIYRSMLLQNLDPSSGVSKAEVYLALGLIHEKVNEAPKAVQQYERGLELEPNHAGLKEALARARGAR